MDNDLPLRGRLLSEVSTIICKDRNNQHGEPEDTHASIARFWTAYLTNKLGFPVELSAADAAQMMVLFKIARFQANPKTRDTVLDEIGYAAIVAEIAVKEQQKCKPPSD